MLGDGCWNYKFIVFLIEYLSFLFYFGRVRCFDYFIIKRKKAYPLNLCFNIFFLYILE